MTISVVLILVVVGLIVVAIVSDYIFNQTDCEPLAVVTWISLALAALIIIALIVLSVVGAAQPAQEIEQMGKITHVDSNMDSQFYYYTVSVILEDGTAINLSVNGEQYARYNPGDVVSVVRMERSFLGEKTVKYSIAK